jgi:hypothetical protein
MLARLIQRYPTLLASSVYAAAVALAFWPFWQGRSLLNPASDLNHVYPFRQFAVEHLKQFGGVAQWNPYIFGGMPFAANVTNGDTFYPGMLLRLFLPVDAGITLGIMIHIVLAGGFTFLFLRALKLEWGPAFVGGAAYMFTGQLVSLVTAGHDGKLAVSALLPLALLCLYHGISRGDWRWYLGFGGTLALSLLSPHVQMTYYLLMVAGFFWLFMVRWSGERPKSHTWLASGLLFVLGLSVGFALSAVQSIPFAEYIGYSPRGAEAAAAGASSTGWAYATSYAMPPEELLNVVWPSFSGMVENYWGRNFLKYHNEYLGIVPLMLACLGFGLPEKRRLAWFFAFLITYGVLFALGGHTPFYRLPYHLLPGIKMTRGAGMIFFVVGFGVAGLSAFGTQAVLRAAGNVRRGVLIWWSGVLGAVAVLALAGAFKGIMVSFAPPERLAIVDANYATFTWDTVRALVIALGVAGLVLALRKRRLATEAWALALGGLTLLDLFSVEQRQIRFGPRARDLFAPDAVMQAIAHDGDLYRVLPVAGYTADNYPMAHGVRTVLGYQGTELHRYDELLGGKNDWRNIGSPNIWRLLAVKYLVVDRRVEFPGLTMVGEGPLETYQGDSVYVYRYEQAQPFARVVAEAFKVPDDQVISTLINTRFDPARLLLVAPDAPAGVATLTTLPDPVPIDVKAVQVRPGWYRFDLASPPARPSYLFVSENYYPAWRATVDGADTPVLRAQYALTAVPLPAGARSVELVLRSRTYRIGRLITLGTLLLVAGALTADRIRRRREGSGG